VGYDGKYGKVTTEYGEIPGDEPVILFRGRDRLVPEMLAHYILLCEQAGSPGRHLDLARGCRQKIMGWQAEHPDRVRVPDSERSRAWMDE
jgi:hypothetical protein